MGDDGGRGPDGGRDEDGGRDPDYRFTLANERTFLAWVRTALALIAGGVAVVQLVPPFAVPGSSHTLGVVLSLSGGVLALGATRRWRQVQVAMRREQDLPMSRLPVALATLLLFVTLVVVALLLTTPV